MPHSKRAWTDDDIAKLRSLAGELPVKDLAAHLGRSPAAVIMMASKLRLSLRVRFLKRRAVSNKAAAA